MSLLEVVAVVLVAGCMGYIAWYVLGLRSRCGPWDPPPPPLPPLEPTPLGPGVLSPYDWDDFDRRFASYADQHPEIALDVLVSRARALTPTNA